MRIPVRPGAGQGAIAGGSGVIPLAAGLAADAQHRDLPIGFGAGVVEEGGVECHVGRGAAREELVRPARGPRLQGAVEAGYACRDGDGVRRDRGVHGEPCAHPQDPAAPCGTATTSQMTALLSESGKTQRGWSSTKVEAVVRPPRDRLDRAGAYSIGSAGGDKAAAAQGAGPHGGTGTEGAAPLNPAVPPSILSHPSFWAQTHEKRE